MLNAKRGLRLTALSCFLLVCCFLSPPACSAVEKAYQVTETELKELESNLNQLQTLAQQSKSESDEQKSQLTELRTRLSEAESLLIKQKTSLQTANELLQQSIAEEKKARNKLHRERSIGLAIIGALLLHQWMD